MSNIVPFNPQGQAPAALQQHLAAIGGLAPSAFTQGIGAGYASVSFKGKVFQIRYNGQTTHLVDPQTNAPMQFFDVVLVDAKAELSKTYYAGAYTEGDNQAPDCSSEDGVHPTAPAGKQVISATCQTCPFNAFGSKVSTDGKATNSKACQDTRKVAIVPAFNMRNENFGGAMLLRIPPDSLKALAQYARGLEAQGAPTYGVVTRIMFDYTVSHPKLTFQALRWVSEDEFAVIKEIKESAGTKEIVSVNTAPQQAAQLPPPVQSIPGQAPSGMQPPVQQAPMASAPVNGGYQAPATAPQPGYQTMSPPVQQSAPQQPPMQAPGVPANPTSVVSSFPQQQQQAPVQHYAPPVQQAPVQQAPVMQPPPQQYAPQMTQAAPQPAYQAPPQQYAPQPQQAPPQQAYAPQPQMQPQQQAVPQQGGPLPQGVISQIDNLLG
jgi:hypothetical protein